MRRILASFAVFGVLFTWTSVTWADFTAEIFEAGSNHSKKLFSFTNQVSEKDTGLSEITTVYKDLEGKSVVEEKVLLKGSELIKLEYSQNQMQQTAGIEVKDGKILFSKIVDGKTKTAEEKLKPPFVVSSSFVRFVKQNWEKVLAGEKLSFRYGSWERMETVGFEIFKIGEGKISDQPIVEIKMKASNFIIAAIVDPLIFKFASDGSKIIEMSGRVAPKKRDGNSWKDLDAEVVYKY